MPEFMVMILTNEAAEAQRPPSETKALVEGHSAYARKLRSAGAFVDGERLRPSTEGRRVSARDGQTRVESGPFGETALEGYYLLKSESLQAAVELAKQCPMSPGTTLDVRPLMKGHLKPEKASQQGHVFGVAVLGNAGSEQGWVEIMDRIDAEAISNFPSARFLGGVRLQAPGTGRQVTTSASGQRAVFDGPFLEGKEVIGGLCFIHVSTLEEAVRWASQSAAVKHGALEIRELWRS